MAGCEKCGSADELTRDCEYCGCHYCPNHLLPERHNCAGLTASESLGPNLYGDDEPVTIGGSDDTDNATDDEETSNTQLELDETRSTPDEPSSTPDESSSDASDPPKGPDDPTYERSPDVNPDGSVAGDQDTTTESKGSPLRRAIVGARAPARYHGLCPHCDTYIERAHMDRLAECADCGWQPGLPGLRLLTHWPNWGHLRRRTTSLLLTTAKFGVLGAILFVFISMQFGTGIPAIDDTVDRIDTSDTQSDSQTQQNAAGVNTTNVERLVHQEINERRANNGLDPITYDPALASIAEDHSKDMIERDFFAHENPDGDDVGDRYDQAGYDCRVATGSGTYSTGGENIAQTWWEQQISTTQGPVSYDTESELAVGIVNQWMNSTGHRANILTEHWESEGIGVVFADDDEVLVTQNFC